MLFLALLLSCTVCSAGSITFHRDVAPIISTNCTSCHHEGGNAPFPLVTYSDVAKRAQQIAEVTRTRYMPPWLPEHGFGEFQDERRLTQSQIGTIEQWVRGGALKGDVGDGPQTQPPVFNSGWQLGKPDLVLTAAKPYNSAPDGPDEFWNFVLTPNVPETRYVQAIEIRPGNPRAVHHANLLLDRSHSARAKVHDVEQGFPGMDVTLESGTFDPDSHFLFWKPGGASWKEPADLAWRLDPGNELVLNVHVRRTGKPEILRPSVALYFTADPPSKFPMLVQLEHDGAIDIPPGARDFVATDHFRLPVDGDVLAIYPHAHYLGRTLEGFATLPNGTRRWLIRIPDWDLNWQSVYRYREPVSLPAGAVITMRYQYDNSAANPRNPHSPPRRVRGGNQSADEMAHLWLQVLPRDGDRRSALQEALMTRRLEKYPADFLANFNLGALFLSRHEIPIAMTHLREALRVDPENPAALNTMGVALQWDGKHAEAGEQFQHVLRLRPNDSAARYNLAGTLVDRNLLEDAARELRRVVSDQAQDRAARSRLVEILKTLGDRAAAGGEVAKATDLYRELVDLVPGDADLRSNFGILLARANHYDSAIDQFEVALKLNPAHAAARRNLEVARRRAGH